MVKDFGECQGYMIKEQVQIGHHIFSLGHNPNAANPYVVWQSNYTSPGEFYWGHYMNSKDSALKDLRVRIVGEMRGILQNIDRMSRRPEVEGSQHAHIERGDGR